jgi:hypothetical protein
MMIACAMGAKPHEIHPERLLPNEPETPEQTMQDQFDLLMSYSKKQKQAWPVQSEP